MLTRNSSGDTRSQPSQLAEPLWTDPGLKREISVRELISTKKKKKTRRRAMNCRTFSPKPRTREKSQQQMYSSLIVMKCGELNSDKRTALYKNYYIIYIWWLFSSRASIWGECSTIHSLRFFFKVGISSRTLMPLFRPESVHSGSAS